MAHSVTHTFVSPVADNSNPNEVGPDEWNAAHTVTLDASELLTSLKTVDGAGSGLDADLLDGLSSAAYVQSGGALGTPSSGTLTNATGLPLATGVTGSLLPANGGAHPGYTAGNWYASVIGGVHATGATIPANSVRLLPFILPRPVTVSDLACRITTLASGGNIRLAIYNSSPTTYAPTTVAAETGNISTTSTGPVSADITGSNIALAAGFYWMAVIADGTAGGVVICQVISAAQAQAAALYGDATLSNVTGAAGSVLFVKTFGSTFGAFPDLTGQTLGTATGASYAAVFFKAA